MIDRYTRREMGSIWELQNKYAIWKEIEILACEAQAKQAATWACRSRATTCVESGSGVRPKCSHT